MPVLSHNYFKNVFINCPFDEEYFPIFYGIVFAVYDCGFIPRCALEAEDSGDVRISKIMDIIEECCYGIHDISRVELSIAPAGNLPRFNMPLELGIFMGAQRFGPKGKQRKNYIILDAEKYRYQQFISDLAGQDIKAHEQQIDKAILHVRNWLATKNGGMIIPGGIEINRRYTEFQSILSELTIEYHLDEPDLTFTDFCALIESWFEREE